MLRDKNLIPLSRQHQHALALCVRLERALQSNQVNLDAWQSEIQALFEQEIGSHFSAEEKVLFPAASRLPQLSGIVEELRTEHRALRDLFRRAGLRQLEKSDLAILRESLAQHIRKEERVLFEGMQKAMSVSELAGLGRELDGLLTATACVLPNQATRLLPRN
jgi:iron-sulfur cluster repair protein YtfE (RIC family)